jgi:hypothetical protein
MSGLGFGSSGGADVIKNITNGIINRDPVNTQWSKTAANTKVIGLK